jgi:hypothetical protein
MHSATPAAAPVVRFHASFQLTGAEKPWLNASLQGVWPAPTMLAPPSVQRAFSLILLHAERRFVTRPVLFNHGTAMNMTWAIVQQDQTLERLALFDYKGRFLGHAESPLLRSRDGSCAGSLPRAFTPA